MKIHTNMLVVTLTVASAVSAFADVLTVGQNNKLDLGPVIVANQSLPTVTVGKAANKDNAIVAGAVNGGVSVNLPFVAASVPLGSVSVGPEALNVKVGNQNSVTVGPLSVGQRLPSVSVGTNVNKDSLFNIKLANGLSVTLPLVSFDIPLPSLSLKCGDKAVPAKGKAATK